MRAKRLFMSANTRRNSNKHRPAQEGHQDQDWPSKSGKMVNRSYNSWPSKRGDACAPTSLPWPKGSIRRAFHGRPIHECTGCHDEERRGKVSSLAKMETFI